MKALLCYGAFALPLAMVALLAARIGAAFIDPLLAAAMLWRAPLHDL